MVERRLEGPGAAQHLGVAFLEELRRGGLASELIKPTHHQFCIDDELRGGGAQFELRPMARFAVAAVAHATDATASVAATSAHRTPFFHVRWPRW